jgi:hypothetical protein
MTDSLPLTFDLPAMWCLLSLDPAHDAVAVPAQVDERINGEPDLAPSRQALIDLFLGWAESARRLEAGLAAMRYEEHATFGLAMATLLVYRVARDPRRSIEEELDGLRDELSAAQPNDQYPPHLEVLDLPMGRSLRLDAVREPATDAAEPEALRFVLQHWIPLGGRGCTLEFEATTSNLALAPDIAAEVDAIVASVAEAG